MGWCCITPLGFRLMVGPIVYFARNRLWRRLGRFFLRLV
ncbi:hypothetical protein LINGRAHAP2_LOCUS14829 [Linum grandiflorum]